MKPCKRCLPNTLRTNLLMNQALAQTSDRAHRENSRAAVPVMPVLEARYLAGDLQIDYTIKRTGTYQTWKSIIIRCTSKEPYAYYYRYAKKGIAICDRWNSFWLFYADMGERPPQGTLIRLDESKGFYRENCAWKIKGNKGIRHLIALKKDGVSGNITYWSSRLCIDEFYFYRMHSKGGLKDELTPNILTCLEALQTNRLKINNKNISISTYAKRINIHPSQIRQMLYRAILPTGV